DLAELAFELLDPLAPRLDGAGEARPLRIEGGDLMVDGVEFSFRRLERGLGLADAGLRLLLRFGLAFFGGAKLLRLGLEPRNGALRILDQFALATEILSDLLQAGGEARGLFLRTRFLGIEVLALDGETVEPGGGFRFLLAERRQPVGGFRFHRARGRGFARQF